MTSMTFSSFDKHIISIEGERVEREKSDFSSRIYGGSCQYYQYHSSQRDNKKKNFHILPLSAS